MCVTCGTVQALNNGSDERDSEEWVVVSHEPRFVPGDDDVGCALRLEVSHDGSHTDLAS